MNDIVGAVSALFGLLLMMGGMMLGLLAAGAPQGEPFTPPLEVFLAVAAAGTLLASGFLYAPLYLARMADSRRHRIVASILLALPIGLGAALLMQRQHPEMRWPALALLVLGSLVLGCLVRPWRRVRGGGA